MNPLSTDNYKACITDEGCTQSNPERPRCSTNNGHGFKMTFCVAEASCGTDLDGGFGTISCPELDAATGAGTGSIYLKLASASLILLGTLS